MKSIEKLEYLIPLCENEAIIFSKFANLGPLLTKFVDIVKKIIIELYGLKDMNNRIGNFLFIYFFYFCLFLKLLIFQLLFLLNPS